MTTDDKDPQQPPRKISSLRMIGRLLTFIVPYWPWLSVAVLMHLLVTLTTFVGSFLTGLVVDDIANSRYDRLWLYALVMVLSAVLLALFALARAWTHTRSTGHAMWDMRAFVFDSLQRLSIGYHERESSGQIISRAVEDINQVEAFYRMVAFMIVEIAVVYITACSVMFYLSWPLALWSLSTLPLAALLTALIAGRIREGYFAVRNQVGDMTTVVQENISGVRVVRGFAQEQPQLDKFHSKSHGIIPRVMATVKLWTFHGALVRFLIVLGGALTLVAGAHMIHQHNAAVADALATPSSVGITATIVGTVVNLPTLAARLPHAFSVGITVGTVVIFFMLQQQIAWRLFGLGRLVSHLQRAVASGDRVFEVLDLVPEVVEKPDAVDLPPGPGRVQFEHASFGYEPDKTVLSDITLSVEPGQMIALVGATGAGKSSLAALLPRFYDVSSGRILIDGIDVRDLSLKSLRRNIGLVFQESFLFSARVVDNIAYGDPNASLEAVKAAAAQARADEFIDQLPEKYLTLIGERGVTLSGGQRQRLTIARAILPNPRILILDDSTSSVDPRTEREIHETMMKAAHDRTTFVIAHRLSTVRRADLIVVLDHGRIAETGTHNQLLARGGLYRSIYDMQFRDDELRLANNDHLDSAPPAGGAS